MLITTNKHFSFHSLNKKKMEKITFSSALKSVYNEEELKEQFGKVLDSKGRLYGIYQKKELVGFYLFEFVENYFSNENKSIKIGEKNIELDKHWFGDMTSIYRMTLSYMIPEMEENRKIIEKDLKEDLKSRIETFGDVAGVEYGEILLCKNGALKGKGSYYATGYLLGMAVGMMFGYFIFDNIGLGLCFGLIYANLFGSAGNSIGSGKNEENKPVLELLLSEVYEQMKKEDSKENEPVLEYSKSEVDDSLTDSEKESSISVEESEE